MKILSLLVASICAVVAAAQGITIGSPTQGQNITSGQELTIQVIKNNFIESSIEAGLVIGFTPCPAATFPQGCSSSNLGNNILYNGPFNPQQNGPLFFQNITVTIPSDASPGSVQIAFARFFLIGAGNSPTIGGASVTVNVVS